MESTDYLSWSTVGLPDYLVTLIMNSKGGGWIDFLVSNRVFRQTLKSTFVYRCGSCGRSKVLRRVYESYPKCEACSSGMISCSSGWNFSKDIEDFSEVDEYSVKIISAMQSNYRNYFDEDLPENFFVFHRNPGEHTSFHAKFICGEPIKSSRPSLAICLAAICCPFLWDDTYDWKQNYHRDKERKTHITPLIYALYQFGEQRRPNRDLSMMLDDDEGGLPGNNNMGLGNPFKKQNAPKVKIIEEQQVKAQFSDEKARAKLIEEAKAKLIEEAKAHIKNAEFKLVHKNSVEKNLQNIQNLQKIAIAKMVTKINEPKIT